MAASKIPFAYTNTYYIDPQGGSDANSGLTMALAKQTWAGIKAAAYTPNVAAQRISFLVVVCGSSDNSDFFTGSTDQFLIDCFGDSRTGDFSVGVPFETHIGIRAAIYEVDGARISSRAYGRPLLRGDTVVSITSGSAWSAVSGTIYKSGNTLVGTPTDMGQLLYKPGTVTQYDTDGAAKSHLYLKTGTGGDAAAIAHCTTAWTAYYDTSSNRLYINDGTAVAPTNANYYWTKSSGDASQNWSKISLSGCTTVAIEGIDTAWTERGIVIFDARQVYINDCRAFEHKVHGILCSYTNWKLQNITIENCTVYGLGTNNSGGTGVGNTMFSATGASGNFDAEGIRFNNCTAIPYMLQNPAGAKYDKATLGYKIYPFGLGTAVSGTAGLLLPGGAILTDCVISHVTSAKSYQPDGWFVAGAHHTVPSDPTNINTYPIIFRRLTARILAGVADQSGSGSANEYSHAVALDDCDIYQLADVSGSTGVAAVTGSWNAPIWFGQPAGGHHAYWGWFNGTRWIADPGTSQSTNTWYGMAMATDSTIGNVCHFTKINSDFLLMANNSSNTIFVYDQADDADDTNKGLTLYCVGGKSGVIYPHGQRGNLTMIAHHDASATTSRVFRGETLIGVNGSSSVSTSNATIALWNANVDTTAKYGTETPPGVAKMSPAGNVLKSTRGRSGR